MKRVDVKFLNIVDDRWPGGYSTIIYTGALCPCKDGLQYSFSYGTGRGWSVIGAGTVESERYSKMSPEEIELICSVENPVTADDIYKACVRGDMTEAYAEKHSGVKRRRPGDAG